jgi:raffinose/stachyose/melibiose transport system substrate-binding protein
MRDGREMVSPLQDAMNKNAREVWLLECVPAVAAGRMTAEECWEKVMALRPFSE